MLGRLAAALILSLAAAAAQAQQAEGASQPVPLPEVKVGDRWTYIRADRPSRPEFVEAVTFVGPDLIIATLEGGGRVLDTHFTSEWNFRVSLSGAVYEPPSLILKFPLQAGTRHETSFEIVGIPGSGFRAKYGPIQVRTVGWEEITVPAGTFRAMKIEAAGPYTQLDTAAGGAQGKWQFWYVPEVRRWVRFVYEWSASRGGGGRTDAQLTGYQLK